MKERLGRFCRARSVRLAGVLWGPLVGAVLLMWAITAVVIDAWLRPLRPSVADQAAQWLRQQPNQNFAFFLLSPVSVNGNGATEVPPASVVRAKILPTGRERALWRRTRRMMWLPGRGSAVVDSNRGSTPAFFGPTYRAQRRTAGSSAPKSACASARALALQCVHAPQRRPPARAPRVDDRDQPRGR